MDDLITGEETVQGAYELYQKTKQVMSEGGFNLRKWNSNSSTLMSQIRQNEAILTTRESDRQDCPGHNIPESDDQASLSKLLGVTWDSQADEFMFKWNSLKGTEESDVSKQSLLRVTASIFDPLGFLSPFVIRLKILFQILCMDKITGMRL